MGVCVWGCWWGRGVCDGVGEVWGVGRAGVCVCVGRLVGQG